eukprot:CAMPEP_0201884128 /NCGR_PEP_ID=MMETSP0902-20130614/16565_1 /ASSEMBLY_ACC=CAM_ASM_000551 /TAXON_ID=420261 /ORGANISM="Thalassiosira antarctica, Strain CCMP982" /LENGTH=73 /DNA_ID=CAMNT_0048413033 /DNA_START=129 /DNA_END=350 /DNA_ORIENTATION=+
MAGLPLWCCCFGQKKKRERYSDGSEENQSAGEGGAAIFEKSKDKKSKTSDHDEISLASSMSSVGVDALFVPLL